MTTSTVPSYAEGHTEPSKPPGNTTDNPGIPNINITPLCNDKCPNKDTCSVIENESGTAVMYGTKSGDDVLAKAQGTPEDTVSPTGSSTRVTCGIVGCDIDNCLEKLLKRLDEKQHTVADIEYVVESTSGCVTDTHPSPSHSQGEEGQVDDQSCGPVKDCYSSDEFEKLGASEAVYTEIYGRNDSMSEVAAVETAPVVVVATASPAAVEAQVLVDVIPSRHLGTCLQSTEAASSGTEEPEILDVSAAEICEAVSTQKSVSPSYVHSAVSELHSLERVQRTVYEEDTAAATVSEDAMSSEPGLPDQLITDGSQNTSFDPDAEGPDSLLLANEDKCIIRSADHNRKLGLGHRGIYHKMRQPSIVSLKFSSLFKFNNGCLKHMDGIFRSRSLRKSVPNGPSVWACIIFMDQHGGQLNAMEHWRNKWKFKLISKDVKCVMIFMTKDCQWIRPYEM